MLNLKVYTIDGSCTQFKNLSDDIEWVKETMSGGGEIFIVNVAKDQCTIFAKCNILKVEIFEFTESNET